MMNTMPDTNRTRVLIVDDSPRACASLRSLLAAYSEHTEIQEARSGLEALDRMDEFVPDVVCIDIEMLDGVDATRVIKTHAPSVRVIALSMSSEYRARALAAGADAFVSKGDPPSALLETLARVARLIEDNSSRLTRIT